MKGNTASDDDVRGRFASPRRDSSLTHFEMIAAYDVISSMITLSER